MSGLIKKAVPAALSLVLGIACANGAGVNISGGSSSTIGGWQISTGAGFNANGISVNGQTLVIQNEVVNFADNGSQAITFSQLSADAVPFIEIATRTITDSTGSDWTGLQSSLNGSGSFDGISTIFAPPIGTGVNYTTAALNAPRTMVTYTGTQLAGSTSNWGSNNPGDELLIDGNPTTSEPFATFTMDESPQGFVSEVVSAPRAAWLGLAGILAVGIVPQFRRAVRIFA